MELINEDLKQVFRSNPLYSQEGKYMEATVIGFFVKFGGTSSIVNK